MQFRWLGHLCTAVHVGKVGKSLWKKISEGEEEEEKRRNQLEEDREGDESSGPALLLLLLLLAASVNLCLH